MKLKEIESFLSILSLMFRKYFLDMRLQYAFSENEEVAEVTVSKIAKGSGVYQTPSAIFSVTNTTVRFIKLDFASEIDFVEYEVSSLFELRMTILYVIFLLIKGEHPTLSLFEFLSKILGSRVESPVDLLRYFCTVNEIDFATDDEFLYVYDYGNFSFFQDAISFMSTQSARVVYRVNSEASVFSVISLIFDALFVSLKNDPSGEEYIKIFKEDAPRIEDVDLDEEEGADGLADFGGGFDTGEGFGGEGGGGLSTEVPVEGGGGSEGFGGGTVDPFKE